MIPGVHPWGGGGWVDGGWGGYGCVGGCPMHARMHMYVHTCTHTHTCMLNMLNMLNMDVSMSAAICNFYTCINVCVCVCMHAHACVWGTPPHAPRCPPTHLPPRQSHREPKTQQGSHMALCRALFGYLKVCGSLMS